MTVSFTVIAIGGEAERREQSQGNGDGCKAEH